MAKLAVPWKFYPDLIRQLKQKAVEADRSVQAFVGDILQAWLDSHD